MKPVEVTQKIHFLCVLHGVPYPLKILIPAVSFTKTINKIT